MLSPDIVALHKAILWEETKGKLRALIVASGHGDGTDRDHYEKRAARFDNTRRAVETFIKEMEDAGLHE